jgi:hypothetical protein
MFAAWLKFGCALMCALALSFSEAAGERVRADAAEEAGAEWSRAAKPDAALLSGARGAWSCPLATAAKATPARPMPVAAWAQVDERETRLRVSARPPSCRSQTASAEGRSKSGVVRLLI